MVNQEKKTMAIDNDRLLELANEYGTPLYVYDGDLIEKRYNDLINYISWPKLKILYAMKANYNLSVLKLIYSLGGWLDTVSPAEILLAKKVGFKPENILYTANNMTDSEVDDVQESGVLLNIGSLSRLERYGKKYQGSKVCIRFNPDVVAGAHKKIQTGGKLTKFGVLLEDVDTVKSIADTYNLRVIGLHEHTGSGIDDTNAVFQSIRNLLSIAGRDNFPDLEFIDFGGGFQVPYHPEETRIDYGKPGQKIGTIFSDYCSEYGRELEMYFEPGKFIVAESGYLLVTVNTLKDNRGRLIAGTNSGFPQLIRPMFYEAYHHIANISNCDGKHKNYDVCGNICETGDRFAEKRAISEIREGDVLSIENAGAYCYAMGGVYNLRAMPAEVFVYKNEIKSARKRLTNQELVDTIIGECEWLQNL